MPRYKFKWSNLPPALLTDLCAELVGDDNQAPLPEALRRTYGARPDVELVRYTWPILRDSWLATAKEPRERVVQHLRQARGETGAIRGKRTQMDYLRGLRNTKALRTIVWRELVAAGETQQSGAQTPVHAPPAAGANARTILLRGLTKEGRLIVESPRKQLLVVAGAGAGKTEAMARRIGWWHAVEGVSKDEIVAFTFTERAAEEMKFRVRRYMGLISPNGTDPSLGGMYVGTIHSYCMNTLRRLWPREFHNDEILDNVARYALVQQGYDWVLGLPALANALSAGKAYTQSRGRTIDYFLRAYDLLNEYNHLHVRLPHTPRPAFGQESEWCKQAELETPVGDDDVAQAFARSAARYYAYLRCRHFLDFSTSQSELVRRLQQDSKQLAELRKSITHLVVDEEQDVNVVQDALRKLLVGTDGHLTAVGDHRQAIYGFRGGRIDLMADLAAGLTDDPDGAVLELTANFRSTPRIVDLSNEWNRTIPPPVGMASPAMTPGNRSRTDADPSHVMTSRFPGRAEEATWIADTINRLVRQRGGAFHDDKDGTARGITYSDIAVLVRSSTDARTYQGALRGADIPAVVRPAPTCSPNLRSCFLRRRWH